MAEYIERDSVLSKLLEYGIGWGAAKVKGVINSIPAADVAPVRHGRWMKCKPYNHEFNGYECSECGARYQGFSPDNYCPNCGALMDKEG